MAANLTEDEAEFKDLYENLLLDYDDFQVSSKEYEAELESELEHMRELESKSRQKAETCEIKLSKKNEECKKNDRGQEARLRVKEDELEKFRTIATECKQKIRDLEILSDSQERELRLVKANLELQEERSVELQEEKECLTTELQEHETKKEIAAAQRQVKMLQDELAQVDINRRNFDCILQEKLAIEKQFSDFKRESNEEKCELKSQLLEQQQNATKEHAQVLELSKQHDKFVRNTEALHKNMKESRAMELSAWKELNEERKMNDWKKRANGAGKKDPNREAVRQRLSDARQQRVNAGRRDKNPAARRQGIVNLLVHTGLQNDGQPSRQPNGSSSPEATSLLSGMRNSDMMAQKPRTMYLFLFGDKWSDAKRVSVTRATNTWQKLLLLATKHLQCGTGPVRKIYHIEGEYKLFSQIKELDEVDTDEYYLAVGAGKFNESKPDLKNLPTNIFEIAAKGVHPSFTRGRSSKASTKSSVAHNNNKSPSRPASPKLRPSPSKGSATKGSATRGPNKSSEESGLSKSQTVETPKKEEDEPHEKHMKDERESHLRTPKKIDSPSKKGRAKGESPAPMALTPPAAASATDQEPPQQHATFTPRDSTSHLVSTRDRVAMFEKISKKSKQSKRSSNKKLKKSKSCINKPEAHVSGLTTPNKSKSHEPKSTKNTPNNTNTDKDTVKSTVNAPQKTTPRASKRKGHLRTPSKAFHR